MIVIFAALSGAIIGGLTAKKRGGAVADIAQYATIYTLIFAMIGLLATIVIHRMSV